MKLELKISLVMAGLALCTFLYPVFKNSSADSEKINVELAKMRTCMEHSREDWKALNKLVLKMTEDIEAVKVDIAGLKVNVAVLKAKVEH